MAQRYWSRAGNRAAQPNCICEICSKEFHRKPSAIKKGEGKTCSYACRDKRKSLIYSGPNSHMWKGGPEHWQRADRGAWIDCAGCGVHVRVKDKRYRYCSSACHHRTTAKRGPEHHSWTGGKKPRNLQDMLDWRNAVLRRDDWTCQHCGKRGGKLHAHHVKRWIDYPELRNDVSNGITLCRSCHLDVHRGEPRKRLRFA